MADGTALCCWMCTVLILRMKSTIVRSRFSSNSSMKYAKSFAATESTSIPVLSSTIATQFAFCLVKPAKTSIAFVKLGKARRSSFFLSI